MGRLYTYVVKHDTGLAPNPFWGWCTLAVCTPNHQGSRVQPGDWIAGVFDKSSGHRLAYVMEVAERIHMNDYFQDSRFEVKKPRPLGTWMQRCGDNFYSQDGSGTWRQHPTMFHCGTDWTLRDTKHPWVFAGSRFWYLGREAVEMPGEFLDLVGGRGARVNHPEALVREFRSWVATSLKAGVGALPRDIQAVGCGAAPSYERAEDGRGLICD